MLGQNFALLAYGNFQTFKVVSFKICRVQCMCIFSLRTCYMFYSCWSISRRYPVLPIEKFLALKLPWNAMLQNLIIQFPVYQLSSGRLWRLKTKENFRLIAPKVLMVAYESWVLAISSRYSNLTWKLLVFWKTGY